MANEKTHTTRLDIGFGISNNLKNPWIPFFNTTWGHLLRFDCHLRSAISNFQNLNSVSQSATLKTLQKRFLIQSDRI